LFDRFYRVEESRSRDAGGAGLGLSIAKWAVEAHGGRISLKSPPGEGATFQIQLPAA
jgi:signal transduction histidine kinase